MLISRFYLDGNLNKAGSLQQLDDVVQAEDGQGDDQKRRGDSRVALNHADRAEDELVLIGLRGDDLDFGCHGVESL